MTVHLVEQKTLKIRLFLAEFRGGSDEEGRLSYILNAGDVSLRQRASSVFEDIADRHGQCWMHHIYLPSQANKPETAPRDFKFLSQGEDLAFCIRAKEAGHRIWCAYVPGLKHHKGRTLSHDEERTAAMVEGDHGVGQLVQEGVV